MGIHKQDSASETRLHSCLSNPDSSRNPPTTIIQEQHDRRSHSRTQVRVTGFPCPKAQWKVKTHTRPVKIKHISVASVLQAPVTAAPARISSNPKMVGQDRPQRRIPSCCCPPTIQNFPRIQMGTENILVPGHALRLIDCPSGIHRPYGVSPKVVEGKINLQHCLSGRLDSGRRFPGRVLGSSECRFDATQEPRFYNKLRKIRNNTIREDYVARSRVGCKSREVPPAHGKSGSR